VVSRVLAWEVEDLGESFFAGFAASFPQPENGDNDFHSPY